MDALVPAFIAALLCQATDRASWLSAILADRYRRPLLVAAAALVANAIGNAIAVVGAQFAAPMLTPEAQSLLLAMALAGAGVDGLFPVRAPGALARWRLGPLVTPLAGLLVATSGDRTQFFTLALGARAALPWTAAAGAVAGAALVHLAAALLGERGWRALPLAGLRIVSGVLSLGAGVLLGVAALGLI